MAASRLISTTLGTVTGGGPFDTTIDTVDPLATSVPVDGSAEITTPASYFVE